MDSSVQDLRYGIRLLVKQPVFTLVAVLSLALGIGANTAIFSLVDALFWRTLPVESPETLVSLYTRDEKNPGFAPLSHLNWKDYREMSRSFSGVLGYSFAPVSLQPGAGEPVRGFALLVSGNYFDLLGVRPALGRTFLPEEDGEPGAHPVAVVSHPFWQENLGGDPAAVGKPIKINGSGYTVIGVAPESFTGLDLGGQPQLWIPMAMNRQIQPNEAFNWYEKRRGLFLNARARLRPGVTLSEAQAELATIAQRLQRDYPDDNKGRSVVLVPLAESMINPQARQGVVSGTGLLMVVVGLVLLIACANVSNLLLAQAAGRRREIAIRLSQGAVRGRLIRQLLTESLLLALLGGAAGLLVATWVQKLLPRLLPQGPVPALELSLNGRALAFTLGVAVLTGVLFGLVPALQASKADLVSALKNQLQTGTGRLRGFGFRGFLVAGQVALSLVSLIAAGLFVRSLSEVRRIDPGFPVDRLAVLSFDVGLQGWDQPRGEQFYREVREQAAAIPGVSGATLAQAGPFQGAFLRSVFLEGGDGSKDGTLVQVNPVAPEYFTTVGVKIARGRAFTEADREGAPRVVIVNQTMAETLWPGQDPIGKRFHFFGQEPASVVGVARDIKYNFPGEDPQPYVYEPLAQRYVTNVTLVVRTGLSPESALAAVQKKVRAMAPTMPLVGVSTVPDLLDDSLWAPRAGASLLALFGALALALASVGLYGVMSFSVTQRSREIGVRMALGAQNRNVLSLVLRQGLTVVGAGLLVGLLLAFGATRLVANLLFGVTPTDPMAFGVTSALLALVAFGATLIPAMRAISVNPIIAIRTD